MSIVVGRRNLFSGWDALLVPRRFLLDLVRLRGGGFTGGGGDGDGDVSGVCFGEWGGVVGSVVADAVDVSVGDGVGLSCCCLLRLRVLAR